MSAVKEILQPPNLNHFYDKYSIILLILIFAFQKVMHGGWLVSVYMQNVMVNQILTLAANEVAGIVPHISAHNFSMYFGVLESPWGPLLCRILSVSPFRPC
jgi:hypothetical protein